ncbi:MAG: mannose-phosphate guanylyltransferase [Solirubrobacteraceae bacterium]|nr:mannose-phosphate guanylyltransferase [Solirubrobacteraceae bacterium]
MQAVILVGGEGTRLRPLTSGTPKPIVTFVDRPFMGFMLQWLARHDVKDVVMCCGFLATKVRDVLGDGSDFGVRLSFVEEPEPRGTAGALKFAEELLEDRFLMLNGDVLTDVDLGAQLRRHEATGAVGTLGLVPVEDPSAYGLVLMDDDQRVTGFLEKPGPDQLRDVDRYLISAGIYALERSVLDLIPPDRAVSIEREVWPRLVGEGLYGFAAEDAYWLDIGTPDRYLDGTRDILAGHVETAVSERLDGDRRHLAGDIDPGARVTGPVIVEAGASVAAGARVVGPAVLAAGVAVAEHAVVERSVVLAGCRIGPAAHVRRAILAPGVLIGANTIVEDGVVLGEGVDVGADCILSHGMKVFPHTTLPDGAIRF